MKFRFANLIPLIALLLSLLGGAMTSTPVLAASFLVSTPAELINAINTANANGANDVITLSANIVLTAVDNGQNGLPVILTDGGHSLTIEGSGFTLSRDSAAPDFRILQVGPGANVTINDLTVTGGSNAPGAGINMQTDSNLILDNVEVSGNTSSGRAGGVYNYFATLTIQNGSVIGRSGAPNIGCGGGGIFTEGSASTSTTLDASTVSYNESPDCAGGGFYMLYDAQLVIRNGSVVSNNVGGDPGGYPPFTDHAGGGGIYGTASPVITISDSTVSNNTVNCVNNPGCGGGGLKGASSVTITNSTFSNNTVNCNASSECGGGAIYNHSTLSLGDSTVSNNDTTTRDGGGLYNSSTGTATITNSTFFQNDADINGGGIFNNGNLTLTGNTFSTNTAINGNGGGIYNNGPLSLTGGTLVDNEANGNGGGLYNFASGPTVTLTDTAISSNEAASNGGGLYNFGNLEVGNSAISGNNANNGAGIYNFEILTVTNTTLNNNDASNNGGGIYNGDTVTITNSTLSGNSASSGGGIYSSNSSTSLTVTNSTFFNNSATNEGGGIYNYIVGSPFVMRNSTLSNNSAGTNGGGIVLLPSTIAQFYNSIIANSTSGGDCVEFASSETLTNTLIEDGSCSASLSGDPNLASLANNGGPTQTMALQSGSPAMDTGDPATCEATDQRGVTRPINAICDIGAYEYGASILTVTSTTPVTGATVQNLTSILVTFSENALSNGSANAANNTANYILVEAGANNAFDTVSCAGGVIADDVQQSISSISYNNTNFTATLNLSNALTAGNYRLFICGTTSIFSAVGLELNNGASDTTVDFTTTTSTAASSLPDTGFAPNRLTSLPAQPANLAYDNLGDIWIEIPSLDVKTSIVGVPQSANGWNVDWLGQSAGWLHGTAFPSWEGNSVVTGHVYDANGKMGPFANIKNLKHGDQIIVHLFGEKYIFEVRTSDMVFPSSTKTALEHLEDHSYLTLITCQGYNPFSDSYFFRRVIRAVLVEVQGE